MSSVVPVNQPSNRHPSLHLLPGHTKIGPAKVRIVVEGDTINEVIGVTAKRMALEAAKAAGCHKPGISSQTGAYPVDGDGTIVVTATTGALKYRNDFDVQGDL